MPTQRRTAKSATKTSARSTSQSAAKGTKRSSAKSSSGRGKSASSSRGRSVSRSASAGRGRSGTAKSAAAKKSASRTRRAPDALELLTEDHRMVQKMFRKAERLDAGDPQLQQIIEAACAALTEHAQLEEQLFYPALRDQADAEDLLDEAEVEHDVAKDLIAQLQRTPGGDERTKAMFKVLGEYVNHHIEEEEGQMFRKAKRAKMDLAALGAQIVAAKEGQQLGDRAGKGEGDGQRGSSARRGSSSEVGESESSNSLANGGDDEDRNEGNRSRSGRSSTEDASDDEVDVETPGNRAGGSRSSSHSTPH